MTNGEAMPQTVKAKRPPPSLAGRKDLILHTYDSFLIAQTRLFVQAGANRESDSDEINRRRELLLLDDLTSFAIATRRLVELTGLKSFANRRMIPMVYLDQTEEPYQVAKLKDKVGFHTLMNRLIHASVIEHFDDMLKFVLYVTRPTKAVREKLFQNLMLNKNYERRPIEQLLFVSSDEINPVFFSIDDMIQQSIIVADKIVEVCSSSQIFLELNLRGA
jgi:hypothetical protein